MDMISKEEKQKLIDQLGEIIISEVRDPALKISMDIVEGDTDCSNVWIKLLRL